MSTQSVTQFLARVATDERLQAELARILDSTSSSSVEGADRQGATELGKKYGFDFSSEELWAEIQTYQAGSGVLSDDELEAVAGGGGWGVPWFQPMFDTKNKW
jgi:predicted ribosomally synthesized peptide with nif11-like leader